MKKILALVAFVLIGCVVWYQWSLRAVDAASTDRIPVTIESGWSTSAIASELSEQGIIRSPFAFRLYVRLEGSDGSLQAGKFILQKSFSTEEIVDVLLSGKAQELSITIPEGYTVLDIDYLLASQGIIETGAILSCAQTCDFSSFGFLPKVSGLAKRGGQLEGYLYPDTYFIEPENFIPKFFLERLLGAFRKNVVTDLAEDIAASKRSLHEIVTMASLIEEETITDEERPVVSGILWKRFDDNRGLGVDAAVRYILEKPSDEITYGDLNVDSPYNIRKFRGLPPGPIASPGLASIKAALNPEETKYWYYLHDRKGQIHYAETNEEHNLNRYYHLGAGADE